MGKVESLVPEDGLGAKAFLKFILDKFGDDLAGVMVIGICKDTDVVDGWSLEVAQGDPTVFLGALEQFKLDFWHTLFKKRAACVPEEAND